MIGIAPEWPVEKCVATLVSLLFVQKFANTAFFGYPLMQQVALSIRGTGRMPKTFSTIKPIILKHAIELFGDRGYDGVSTRDLAAAAKTVESSIYRLYQSKENLYQVAIKDVGKRAQEGMGQVLLSIARGGQGDPRKQIAETVRGWYDSLLQADARVLQQVLKQVHPYDRKLREHPKPLDQAVWTFVASSQLVASAPPLDGGWRGGRVVLRLYPFPISGDGGRVACRIVARELAGGGDRHDV